MTTWSRTARPPTPCSASWQPRRQPAFPDDAGMQIGPEQGTFMTLLTQLTGARRALEIGTFTGYSSICIARGLADGGKLTCCDVSDEWTSVARKYWDLAGLADRIDLQLRPAVETLRSMPAGETFDIAFIDADKTGYVSYWDEVVPRIRPGGVILVDNTLSHGRVVDPGHHRRRTSPESVPSTITPPRTTGSCWCCCRSATA